MFKKTLCIAMAAAALAGCDKQPVQAPAPASLTGDMAKDLRGVDANANGIRDQVEAATGPMATDVTERLRLLAYVWSLQQGMEAAMMANDDTMTKAARFMADATACVMMTTNNGAMGINLVTLSQLTADSPLRKDAWARLQGRLKTVQVAPGNEPCRNADELAASIVNQTSEKFKARQAAAAASAASTASVAVPAASAPAVAASAAAAAASK